MEKVGNKMYSKNAGFAFIGVLAGLLYIVFCLVMISEGCSREQEAQADSKVCEEACFPFAYKDCKNVTDPEEYKHDHLEKVEVFCASLQENVWIAKSSTRPATR